MESRSCGICGLIQPYDKLFGLTICSQHNCNSKPMISLSKIIDKIKDAIDDYDSRKTCDEECLEKIQSILNTIK